MEELKQRIDKRIEIIHKLIIENAPKEEVEKVWNELGKLLKQYLEEN